MASCFDLRLVLTNEMTSANEIAAESSYLCVKTYEYVTANCFFCIHGQLCRHNVMIISACLHVCLSVCLQDKG